MGFLDKIKNFFVPTEEETKATKDKMWTFMKQALKRDNLDGFEIVYGKLSEKKDNLITRITEYHNYAIAFNKVSGEMIILPIDPKLASCGWPIFINKETVKSTSSIWSGIGYCIELKDGDVVMFDTPSQNYKIGKTLGAMEIPIMQEKEVKEFENFFKFFFGKNF